MRIEKIRLEQVYKAYGDIKALKDVSLPLYQGEVLGIAGLSGSGKSVLADIISGRTDIGGGQLYVDGRGTVFTSICQAQALGIFCVRYRTSVIDGISVMENLCLLQRRGHLAFPARDMVNQLADTFRKLGVECRMRVPVRNLSLLEKHTIEICRAFCAGMKVLVLDGIARDYTWKETEYIKGLIMKLKEQGVSILWIETRPEMLMDMADRLAVLRKGSLAAVLHRDEFKRSVVERIIIGETRKSGCSINLSQGRRNRDTELLSVQGVTAQGLKNVDFHVCPGEVVGFIHPEDTYCREIVRLLSGELKVVSGRVRLEGQPIELSGGRKNMVRHGIGFIEDYKKSLFPKLDVAENLTIAGLAYFAPGMCVNGKLEQAIACDYLELLDIKARDLYRPIETLSHRCQLNVALYKWIIAKARFLVIDNLFSGTDILMRNSVREFLEFAKSKNIGIVYCSPNERELSSVCSRMYELSDGRVSSRTGSFPETLNPPEKGMV